MIIMENYTLIVYGLITIVLGILIGICIGYKIRFKKDDKSYYHLGEDLINDNDTAYDLLINLYGKDVVGNLDEFKIHCEYYKKFLSENLSEFSLEDILKIYKYDINLRKIYNFTDFRYYLYAIEFELRKGIIKHK